MSWPTILIAGGGTGGHVFPAVAVAEAIEALAQVDVVFCGTRRGVENRVVPKRGWRLELLDVEPLNGVGPARALRAAAVATRATTRALALLRQLRPRVVLGVGGYVSGPVALAAGVRGRPLAVLEPNRVVGLANRLVAPFAKRAYLAWDEAGTCFRASARRVYGVPLRRGFAPQTYAPQGSARVLILGGSQGAAALNERMPEAIRRVEASSVLGLDVVHQSGVDRDAAVRVSYAREGVGQDRVTVVPFLEDVASAIAAADIIVARGGAGTIAEITAIGRAAIFVPLPHAADDHQGRNAESLALVGAAVCVRQEVADSHRLANEIIRLLSSGPMRLQMANAARARGKPNAASEVAADLLEFAGLNRTLREGAGGIANARLPLDEAH